MDSDPKDEDIPEFVTELGQGGHDGEWRTPIHLHFYVSALRSMERVKGIEPSSQAWEARILPLNHTRVR